MGLPIYIYKKIYIYVLVLLGNEFQLPEVKFKKISD